MAIFRKRLDSRDIDRHLTIPASDAAKFNLFKGGLETEMKVKDVKGKQWILPCSKPSQSSGITIRWGIFVKEHKLQKDDIIEFCKESGQPHEYKVSFERGKVQEDNTAESNNTSDDYHIIS